LLPHEIVEAFLAGEPRIHPQARHDADDADHEEVARVDALRDHAEHLHDLGLDDAREEDHLAGSCAASFRRGRYAT